MNLKEWILLSTYLKTVKNKLPNDWIKPAEYRRMCFESNYKKFYESSLFEEEILLNYYKLEQSDKSRSGYLNDMEYAKAKNEIRKVEEQMISEELINDNKKKRNVSQINFFYMTNEGVKAGKRIYQQEVEKIRNRLLELDIKDKIHGLSEIEKKEKLMMSMKLLENN